jgi:tetratricopeptide (TPR) repeat protein
MTDATKSSQDQSPVRLAVFETVGSEKTHIATISITEDGQGNWQVTLNGTSESDVARVQAVFDRFAADQKAQATLQGQRAVGSVPALTETLKESGFIVEQLPDGDYSLNIQIDLKRGMVFGTNEAKHELVPKDDSLGRRIIEALTAKMSTAFDAIAVEIDGLVADGKHTEAVLSLKRFIKEGAFGRPGERFLQSLLAIDVAQLSSDDRRLVRNARTEVAHGLKRFDIMGAEADAMLSEYGSVLDPGERATLRMAVALRASHRGNKETAIAIWRSLLKEPSDLTAEGRGWAWRNISKDLSVDDPEAKTANKHSADAFLEAGNKDEAGRSLMGLVNILMKEDPAAAVTTLNEIIELIDKEGLANRYVRAAAFHARANRLAALHAHEDAYRDAAEAVALYRGLIGAETEFVSSLHLAAIEARHVGAIDDSIAFEVEANKLTDEAGLAHFQLSRRVVALSRDFDATTAGELLRDAEAAGNAEIVASVQVFQATLDPALSDSERLEMLEATLGRLRDEKHGRAMMQPVQLAIGQQLVRMGHPDRAVKCFRDILTNNPLDQSARQFLVDCLWQTGQWDEAAKFLRRQLDLAGNMPGLLFAYGKSLFNAGDLSGAVTALTESLKLVGSNADLKKAATDLRDQALDLGGTIRPARTEPPKDEPVTREEFEAALSEFGKFISGIKRMEFWDSKDNDYEWIPSPERQAQNFLHIYLKARFQDRVDVFEELGAGAGRIDLYVRLIGGLSIVVELKMCGFRYSSSYAAAGEDQILHYMDNRHTHLGYLVVFDARLDKYGEKLLSGTTALHTVIEVLVDVRPRVGRKKK